MSPAVIGPSCISVEIVLESVMPKPLAAAAWWWKRAASVLDISPRNWSSATSAERSSPSGEGDSFESLDMRSLNY